MSKMIEKHVTGGLGGFRELSVAERTRLGLEILASSASVLGSDKEFARSMSETIASDHRTNQQSLIRCLVFGLKEFGVNNIEDVDSRNAASVQFCYDLEKQILFFPFI